MDYALSIVAFIFLVLPGVLIGPALLRRTLGLFGSIIVGFAIGLVILLDVDVLLSYISKTDGKKLSLAIGLVSVVALFTLFRSVKRQEETIRVSRSWLILPIIAGGVIVRAIPLLRTTLPLGWDTTFHLLIAKSSLMSGKIPQTWEPFEKFALNYPWGSHVLMANISQVTGVELHAVFSACIIFIFSALSIGAIYAVASSLQFPVEARLGSAFAYAFLANSGSLDYFRWGGLPNQVGMFLFLCAIAVFTSRNDTRFTRIGLAGYLLSGVVIVHHHSMFTAFGVFAFIALTACIARGRPCAIGYEAAAVIGIALVASWFQSWKLFARVGDVSSVGALRFKEMLDIFQTPFVDGGIVLVLCAAIGFAFLYRDKSDGLLFLHGWTAALFTAFVLGYYVWKIYTRQVWGDAYVAMTPSRFLTDMAYPLSLYAGLLLARLFTGKEAYKYFIGVVLIMVSGYYVSSQLRPPLDEAQMETMTWLEDETVTTSLIINEGPGQFWVPYLTGREVTLTPIPISEHEDEYKGQKFILTECVLGKRNPAEYETIIREFSGRDIYVYRPEPLDRPYLPQVYANGDNYIYRLDWQTLKGN